MNTNYRVKIPQRWSGAKPTLLLPKKGGKTQKCKINTCKTRKTRQCKTKKNKINVK